MVDDAPELLHELAALGVKDADQRPFVGRSREARALQVEADLAQSHAHTCEQQ